MRIIWLQYNLESYITIYCVSFVHHTGTASTMILSSVQSHTYYILYMHIITCLKILRLVSANNCIKAYTMYTYLYPTNVYYATIEDADDVNCILLYKHECQFKPYYRRKRWTSFSSYMFLNGYITGSNDEVSTAGFFIYQVYRAHPVSTYLLSFNCLVFSRMIKSL